ncbi:hypothetical protein EV11_1288 [Prochlorococcus sp. SS52]|nr:hypothetical protein EV08_0408 [Prochlorococcus marinus str. SS2]KGG24451.1 hypothetical protein EV09_0081 [Prochlorococcus marinus str. SS35]KGG33346.1 hypothetical protein EV10_0553 [Prochlorococcus marinus str. SS51]KGG35487.1 hypothetical protein EV11_1288 [Prochlorococcus sp. SS52]
MTFLTLSDLFEMVSTLIRLSGNVQGCLICINCSGLCSGFIQEI